MKNEELFDQVVLLKRQLDEERQIQYHYQMIIQNIQTQLNLYQNFPNSDGENMKRKISLEKKKMPDSISNLFE